MGNRRALPGFTVALLLALLCAACSPRRPMTASKWATDCTPCTEGGDRCHLEQGQCHPDD